jgi:hypothetical protein
MYTRRRSGPISEQLAERIPETRFVTAFKNASTARRPRSAGVFPYLVEHGIDCHARR